MTGIYLDPSSHMEGPRWGRACDHCNSTTRRLTKIADGHSGYIWLCQPCLNEQADRDYARYEERRAKLAAHPRCEHCGGPLPGQRRVWCSDGCQRHESRVTRGLLDPCDAHLVIVGQRAHIGLIRPDRTARTLCGRAARRIAYTPSELGITGLVNDLVRCELCERINRP